MTPMPPEPPEADMTEHDPAVVADDAYLDAIADDLPLSGDPLERAITEWRDDSRRGTE